MKIILHGKSIFMLRFDTDEDVIFGLNEFCMQQNISAASFSAIGAAKRVVLSYYNLETKKYQDLEITQDVEIVGVLYCTHKFGPVA